MKEREEERKYLPESHWFSQMSSQKELTWREGEQKYKYGFFNTFNPRKVFDRRYNENRNLRLSIVNFFVERGKLDPVRLLDDRLPSYFKDIGLKRGRIFTLEFTYKGNVVGILDPRIDDPTRRFTKVQGKATDDFTRDIIAYHELKSVEEVKPQIKTIMTDEKPREKLTPPRPPTPPKPSMLSSAWSFVKSTASSSADWIKTKSDESLDNTSIESSKVTTQSYYEIEQQSSKNQIESYKRMNEENQKELDRMSKQISQQSKEISDKKDEIRELKTQLETSREDNEELNQEIETKNYDLRQIETAFDNLKAERDRIVSGAQKHIQDRDSQIQELKNSLDLTGSQILRRDEDIKMLQNKLEKTEEYVKRFPQDEENYKNTIVDLKNRLKKEKSEHKDLKDSYGTIRSELREKEKSFDDELSKRVESIQSLLESEKGKVKNLKQSQKELEKRNKNLVQDFEKLDSVYEANKASLEGTESALEDTILELKSLQDEYQKVLEGKDLSEERVLEVQQEIESIKKDLQDERDNYSELVKSKENLEKRYRDVKQKLRDHQSQTNQYSKSMQQELDDSRVQKGKYEELEQERDNSIEETQELNRKLETYKLSLEAVNRKNELDLEKQLQKLKNSNERLQDIQRKLDAKEIDAQKFKQLFQKSENRYKITKSKLDKIIQSTDNNIKELLEKNEAQEKKIQELEEIEEDYVEKVKIRDGEIQRYLGEVGHLKQQIDSLVSKVSLQDVYKDQFNEMKRRHENTTREYHKTLNERNLYIQDLSKNETQRHALEKELADVQKELDSQKLEMENLQKKMIDPQDLEETRNHVRELSNELNKKEDLLHDKEAEANHFREETKNLREYIRGQKIEIENEMFAQRQHYEEKIEKREKEFANQLKNYIRPGEIKAINMGFDKLDAIEVKKYSDEEYEKIMKELRTIRDRNRRIAENPSESSAKRRKYDRLRKNVDYKIDLINHENEKAIHAGHKISKNVMFDIHFGQRGLAQWIYYIRIR